MNDRISFLYRLGLRFCIVIIYLILFACFFYLPKFYNRYVAQQASLNIFTFSEFFTPKSIRLFEEKYNVKVNINYYDSNEELFAKFKITGGKGYDIVIPSDYMVEKMIKEKFLMKLDHTKLPIMEELDKRFLDVSFDPENSYSLPLHWVTYGILYKKSMFAKKVTSLSLKYVFEPVEDDIVVSPYKIAMLDDAIEAVLFSSIYLYGEVKPLQKETVNEITALLIKQKSVIASYLSHDIRTFLSTGLFQLALTSSMNAKRLMKESDDFDFKIPEEGSLFVIENIAIPAASEHTDLAYCFINEMLAESVAKARSEKFGSNPTNVHAYASIDQDYLTNENFYPTEHTFARLQLTCNTFSPQVIEEVWLKVKSK